MKIILATLATTTAALAMLLTVLGTPAVHQSHTTGACVRVEPPQAGTCQALPERYSVVWVQ